ncbi:MULTISPECIES: stage III sporulation protein AF [Bacillus]|uniref:Stage III sporulation protein AF n=1 Tax=Bacillus pseudomycoides TaxID=64104 RepID=A0AAJ1YZC7_9BACI|nr:stage III sporulation protein AF [Bacillus pseudomycoides]EEM04127.1 Stage III sporulation protein AF [Bacillus pseudomycoides]EEM09561.1 Stage III sporulation protein AF [Bacillus pseudomycoides]KFN16824.1 stage III sporulation protein AF [Bacillus pseudomycoides]MBD5796614.1 stage III sporulation protein AF [Bacillus pseudomycoides]MCR8857089.1 stage III sporulation protein AF [Bacillus pseudomycoides]
MQFVTEWIRNIIVFLLLATMLHLILPNSNLQKYVKFVVSLLLVVLILTPLFKLLQTDVNEVIANFNQEKYVADGSIKNSIDTKKKEIQALTRAYSLEEMAVKMKKEVGKEFEKKYGVTVSEIKIIAAETKEEVKAAKDIQSVIVTLKEAEVKKNDAIETVKPVEINTRAPQKTSEETNVEMKQFFSSRWQLEDKQIQVQMEGGTGRVNGQ